MTYKVIQTEKIIEGVSSILNERGIEHTTHHRKYGAHGPLRVARKEYVCIDLKGLDTTILGDGVTPQLRLYTSHDKSAAFRIMLGAFRWVCWNGLSCGEFAYSQRVIHRIGPTADSKLGEIPDRINGAIDFLQGEFVELMEDTTSAIITDEQAIQIIGSLHLSDAIKRRAIWCHFHPRRTGDISHQNNLWGLWNNVNESIREKSRRGSDAVGMTASFKPMADNDKVLNDIIILNSAA